MPGKIHLTAFDPNKKSDWLFADAGGVLMSWVALAAIAILLSLVTYGLTGIRLYAPLAYLHHRFDLGWKWGLGASVIPPFVLVFLLRCNLTVIGSRRQFRYVCRWL